MESSVVIGAMKPELVVGKTYLVVTPGIQSVSRGEAEFIFLDGSMLVSVTNFSHRRCCDIDQWSIKFHYDSHIRSYGGMLQRLRDGGLIGEEDIVTLCLFQLVEEEEEEEVNDEVIAEVADDVDGVVVKKRRRRKKRVSSD